MIWAGRSGNKMTSTHVIKYNKSTALFYHSTSDQSQWGEQRCKTLYSESVSDHAPLCLSNAGTLAWVEKLKWSGLEEFLNADRRPLYPPSGRATHNTGAFVQSYKNMVFYWILKAGHMVRDCSVQSFSHLPDSLPLMIVLSYRRIP